MSEQSGSEQKQEMKTVHPPKRVVVSEAFLWRFHAGRWTLDIESLCTCRESRRSSILKLEPGLLQFFGLTAARKCVLKATWTRSQMIFHFMKMMRDFSYFACLPTLRQRPEEGRLARFEVDGLAHALHHPKLEQRVRRRHHEEDKKGRVQITSLS